MTVFALPAAVLDAVFASEAAPELEHQVVEVDEVDDDALLELYARHQRARGLSVETLRTYHVTYRRFVRALHARGLTLLTVERDVVATWIEGREDKKRTNRTRSLYTSRLDLLFQWLQDEGHRADLPTKGLPRAKIPRSVPRPIPTEGLFAALARADARTGLMLTLTAFAGMRRAEIAQMDRSDVLDDRDPPLLLIHGKGQKERLVPIGPAVAEAFARYRLPASGPIFPGRQPGTAIRPHTVGLLISNHLRSCGVDCTAHQGRHSFATRLYQTSGDLRLTQELMGHASPATTAIYAAYAPEKAADAIANL